VQRFRDGFYWCSPPDARAGRIWDEANHARQLAQEVGFVLAAELRAHGVDLSLAPVLTSTMAPAASSATARCIQSAVRSRSSRARFVLGFSRPG